MHDTPNYSRPLKQSDFFGDNQASRPILAGTVARGQLNDDELLYRGTVNGNIAEVFPFPVTDAVMARGRERFDVYCSPCHGQTGEGNGMVVQRGYRRPPSLMDERLRQAPVGHFFDVMTNGFGAMPDYAVQVKPTDRWAITAYVRALQLSGHDSVDDVPAAERPRLDAPPQTVAEAGAATERH
jgi:mono/diheme cytochrome c family protein